MFTYKHIRLAKELKNKFDTISPFIQRHTSIICPYCENVCCINKHGYHDKEDIIFLSILGVELPSNDNHRGDSEPCKFLTEKGCCLERWMRPFRCTWYFCEPLLESMKEDKGRRYREFVMSLQSLIAIRQEFLEGFVGKDFKEPGSRRMSLSLSERNF
jgi:hypothetical protein